MKVGRSGEVHLSQWIADPWACRAVEKIHSLVHDLLLRQGSCGVILTGGRSAARFYQAWAQHPEFQNFAKIDFFFGDERCVPPDAVDSNYGMAMRTLFAGGVPPGCTVWRMEAESADLESAADRYAATLPENADVLLLGVGEDGHIASLFPHGEALHERTRRVVPVTGPKPPCRRLTITPPVVRQAKVIFLLAAGPDKTTLLAAARAVPDDIDSLPVRLVPDAIWLLDRGTTVSGHNDHRLEDYRWQRH